MWARTVQGQRLTFHLAGIHNQNFLMRDEESGSFWQQVTGRCIAGPMRGAQLERVHSDELALAQFVEEAPQGSVLVGDAAFAEEYAPDWEAGIAKLPTVVDTSDSGMGPRSLVAGIVGEGQARAYRAEDLEATPVLLDEVGGVPVLVWSRGGRSLRVFERRIEGATLLLAPAGEGLRDAETGSVWDARGCATAGARAGQCMRGVQVLWDFWFDWRAYNPETSVYGR